MPKVRSREKVQQIAIYQTTRRWRTRADGVRQRYKYRTRFEIRGKGKNLYKAYKKILDEKLTPKQKYVKVSASAFDRRWRNYAYVDEERRTVDEIDSPKERERGRKDRWIFGR